MFTSDHSDCNYEQPSLEKMGQRWALIYSQMDAYTDRCGQLWTPRMPGGSVYNSFWTLLSQLVRIVDRYEDVCTEPARTPFDNKIHVSER